MKAGKTLQELAIELDRQNKAKRDYLIDTPALAMVPADEGIMLDLHFGEVNGLTSINRMDLNDIAHRQIGQNLGIPAKYYDKMRDDYPELLSANVNGWFNHNPSKRMLRTLDGRIRAYLSDRYRRIDNFEIAQTVLPIIGEIQDARVESCELTDARMYIKVVNPRLTSEVVPGDVVQAGIMITNSETGQGAVNVQPLLYRLVCKNGMVANDAGQRRYHVGRGNESDDSFGIFRDATIEADDRAFMMKLEDTVRAAVDQAKFNSLVSRLRESIDAKMDVMNVPKIVELSSKEFGLRQEESEGVLGHLIQGGDLSLYGLANAVTRHSRDVESYDRATELESVGWNMVTMAPTLWRRLNAFDAA